jgi:D-3-phosphoglycerate dehydrogenase
MHVLFIDTVHPILEEKLTQSGYLCVDGTHWNHAQIMERISEFHGIVIRSKFTIDRAFLNNAIQLKFIARSGSGLENIDMDSVEDLGIRVFNSPEGNRNAVGEHALGMLLMLFNKLKQGDEEVRKRQWNREKNRGIELDGMTVGLIGYGNTAQWFAKKLSGFDVEVIAYDKYAPNFPDANAKSVSLEEIQKKAHVISFHVPETDETRYMFNEDFIANCQNDFFLINTSRGKVVKTSALVSAMKDGKVRGTCLDVLEYESKSFSNFENNQIPEDFTYLATSENTVLSPHVAGWTVESYVKLSTYLFEKIIREFGLQSS